MFEMEEVFPEYDNLNIEDLDTTLDDLNQRLLISEDPSLTERITYINGLLAETNFGGEVRGEVGRVDDISQDVFAQVDKYVQDSREGQKLNPYSESVKKGLYFMGLAGLTSPNRVNESPLTSRRATFHPFANTIMLCAWGNLKENILCLWGKDAKNMGK